MVSQKKITLKDVADDAGVSKSTVSLVLSNNARIPERTRQRVLDSIDRLGYVYNIQAASLRTKRSYTIALVMTNITNPYYAELVFGIEAELGQDNYAAILGNSDDFLARQSKLLVTMQERGVDGIILVPASGMTLESALNLSAHIPLVLVNRNIPGSEIDYVGIDNEVGARLAVSHLIERGHRQIAFIGGPRDSIARHDRLCGYESILEKFDIPINQQLQIESPVTRQGGFLAITSLLARDIQPTAAVCYNDVVAFGVMLGLRQAGIKPGKEFAVIGFDDVEEASLWTPSLTTIASEPSQMGKEAAKLLLQRISNPQAKQQQVIMPSRLIIRKSSPMEIS